MSADVILDIKANDKTALTSIDKINKKLGRTEKQIEKNNSMFSKMSKILGGVAVVAGLQRIASHTINVASNLEEAENKLNAIFGKNGQAKVNEFANAYRDSVGASVLETKNFIADAGNLFTGFGMGADKANNFATEVLQLTNDLASFNNLSTGDAQRRMMSALMGESEAAKGLGASILETQLKVASLAGGFGEYSNKMDENTKILIRFKAIQMQSKNAVGDMARSSGSYVAQLRKMNTAIEKISIILGKALLPAITATVTAIGTFINLISDNINVIQSMIVTVGVLTTAYGTYYLIVNRVALATKVMTMAQTALNFAMKANPIGIVITVVASLIGYLTHLYNTNEKVRYNFIVAWENMKNTIARFANSFVGSINMILEAINVARKAVGNEPFELVTQFKVLGAEDLQRKIQKARTLSNKANIPTATGGGGTSSTATTTSGGGTSSTDSSGGSFFRTFDKVGSKGETTKGNLTIGDVIINITQSANQSTDELVEKLRYSIANEFMKSARLAGVL